MKKKSKKESAAASEEKVLTSIRWDPDVYKWIVEQGQKEGIPFTTNVNRLIRKMMVESNSLEDRLERLEKLVYSKKS